MPTLVDATSRELENSPHPADQPDPSCPACASDKLKANTCSGCGCCLDCQEFAQDCRCEVQAALRFAVAEQSEWRELEASAQPAPEGRALNEAIPR